MKNICTKENPAPKGKPWSVGCNHSSDWNTDYEHPDEVWESMEGLYDDYICSCPNCGQTKKSQEGVDY